MPLTPEDVSNKRFTPVRLREGYDMGEVDAFLDEVEAELTRLHREKDDLAAKLSAAIGGAAAPAVVEDKPEPVEVKAEAVEEKPEPVVVEAEERREPTPIRPKPSEQIRVTTAAEASSAATRLLELATRNADELVDGARLEADEILTGARTDAERLEAETKAQAERLATEARERAAKLDAETEARRRQALGEIEQEKTRLDGEVTHLRTFEREYRARMKGYFTEQLAALDGSLETDAANAGEAS
jgi:DivIVA domain-containing protein